MTKDKRQKSFLNICKTIIVVLFGLLTIILCTSIAWMFDTWQHLSMSELLYQLTAPIEGTNMEMIEDYMISCIPLDVICFSVVVILLTASRKKCYGRILGGILAASVGLLTVTGLYTWNRLDIGEYIKNQMTDSDFINLYYVSPAETELVFPEKKRNLIYIFLESVETTYADEESGGGFSFNCIPELTDLAQEYEDFSGTEEQLNGGNVMPNTSWTAAAMFGQSSGLPLITSIDASAAAEESAFMPQTITIGDILNEAGYNQTLLIGSDATFGSRRTLYTQHGDYQIKDYEYAREVGWIPWDYNVWWGYEDQKLFEFAKQELLELSTSDEPFNLTMLTVDTHFEDGYFCEQCEDIFDGNVYADVMACSSRQVAEFVAWVQEQEFYENTTIVLTGDHLTMDADFCETVDTAYERKTYTTYINSAVESKSDAYRVYTTLDMFPTTLASLGVEIKGNRLGLGTNLYSEEKTLAEQFGVDYLASELEKRTEFVQNMMEGISVVGENYLKQDYSAAQIRVWYYQEEPGILPVTVNNRKNTDTDIALMYARVSQWEDRKDSVWVVAEAAPEDGYLVNIPMEKFWYSGGLYYIDIYVMDAQGNVGILGSTLGYIG